MSSQRMSGPDRAVIYVESASDLTSKSRGRKAIEKPGSNYVIKIQIGEENRFTPVRIDVSGRTGRVEEDSSSGQSSPRSDLTPPLPSRILVKGGCGLRFGSETSESDTESDVSSAEFRLAACPAAQFALRELVGAVSPTSSESLSPRQSPLSCVDKGNPVERSSNHKGLFSESDHQNRRSERRGSGENSLHKAAWTTEDRGPALRNIPLSRKKEILVDEAGFHLNEISDCPPSLVDPEGKESNFAGYKDIFARNRDSPKQIMSDKGTIRGVKNRVRDGIATFLQSNDIKNYSEKEQGRVVVYVTSMGVVRDTFQRCQKVKQILRTLLVKFDERDCYMNRSIQNEIRARLPTTAISTTNEPFLDLPQVFLEGQHLGDTDTIEKLNETGELRDLLRPYKSLSVLSTCERCGGFRMLPCQICNGSKKSVHRNHFTTEFIALKCMHCDPSGLVRCDLCNPIES